MENDNKDSIPPSIVGDKHERSTNTAEFNGPSGEPPAVNERIPSTKIPIDEKVCGPEIKCTQDPELVDKIKKRRQEAQLGGRLKEEGPKPPLISDNASAAGKSVPLSAHVPADAAPRLRGARKSWPMWGKVLVVLLVIVAVVGVVWWTWPWLKHRKDEVPTVSAPTVPASNSYNQSAKPTESQKPVTQPVNSKIMPHPSNTFEAKDTIIEVTAQGSAVFTIDTLHIALDWYKLNKHQNVEVIRSYMCPEDVCDIDAGSPGLHSSPTWISFRYSGGTALVHLVPRKK